MPAAQPPTAEVINAPLAMLAGLALLMPKAVSNDGIDEAVDHEFKTIQTVAGVGRQQRAPLGRLSSFAATCLALRCAAFSARAAGASWISFHPPSSRRHGQADSH